MEYILIFLLELAGIGLHVMQKIIGIGNRHPGKKRPEIIGIFWDEDWDTLIVSAIVLFINLIAHFIVAEYATYLTEWEYYDLFSFGLALVLGYAGQRVIYNYLGTAEKYLNQQVEQKLKV
jgi:hypothetical protein